jgi:hypothetical protein
VAALGAFPVEAAPVAVGATVVGLLYPVVAARVAVAAFKRVDVK